MENIVKQIQLLALVTILGATVIAVWYRNISND